jgi:L-threonylcarbamoyladenylate synthase
MRTEILPAARPSVIAHALDVLQSGGLVAFPTDTVYGLGALAFDGRAVESIYTAKDRPVEKAIPILLAEASQMDEVGKDIPESARKLAVHFWPGPLTILIPKRRHLPRAVSATATVGTRVPDHPVAQSILRAAGPMAVTSANLSGANPPSSAQEVYEQMKGRIALIIDGGTTPGGVPSTLVDCTSPAVNVLREGPVSLEEILSILGDTS